MIKLIVELAGLISLMLGGGGYLLKKAHDEIRTMALSKVSQGLSSTSKLNQMLTCLKYDDNYNESRIMTGHCGKHWRKVDQKKP